MPELCGIAGKVSALRMGLVMDSLEIPGSGWNRVDCDPGYFHGSFGLGY